MLLVATSSSQGVLRAQPDASAPSQDADSKSGQAQSGIRVALPKGKKLVLTDGTFQLAREYSVAGDRVRYWSVERSDWEEIPSAMVDWDATHKAEAEQAAEDAQLKAKIHASEVAMRTAGINVDASLEIKPGLFLPDAVGFYTIIAAATVIGFGLGFTGIDAIHMLVWSAALNGIVAVPIMAMMMVIVANSRLMGRFKARPSLIAVGWIGTGLMALAVAALTWSFLAG